MSLKNKLLSKLNKEQSLEWVNITELLSQNKSIGQRGRTLIPYLLKNEYIEVTWDNFRDKYENLNGFTNKTTLL